MISDEAIERVVEVLVDRIESANTYILEQIGNNIKKIKTVKPSDRYKLEQILKYGGDYDKIVNKIAEVTKMNVRDIKKIFEEVAKADYKFAKKFYEYNGIKYIPWEENAVLRNQVNALANITANEYLNFANTRAIGFNVKNVAGDIIFQNLDDTYIKVIDEAVWNIRQGTDTFDNQMRKIMKELGTSGVKYLDYESGHTRRLDSAVRMNIRGAITSLHNELQQQFGKEFNSDGVEISVHLTPAPDHAEVQGKQFTISKYDENGKLIKKGEFEKFQDDEEAISYDGVVFKPKFEGRDRRSIGEYNCYHYIFSIMLGVSKPVYSNNELKRIVNKSEKTFNFDGKKYTIYEGTQLQRQIETEVRRQKDMQILGKAGDDMQLVDEAQQKITQLTRKYKELSNISGLPTKMERLLVNNYKRIKIDKNTINKD